MTEEQEKPTMDVGEVDNQPKLDPKEEETKIDIDKVAEALKAFNVQDADQLTGKLTAASEAGRLANLLGQERERVRELEQRLTVLESTQAKPVTATQEFDLDSYQEGQTIDLEGVIEKVLTKHEIKKAQELKRVQDMQIKAWNRIRNDRNYEKVRPIWEEKLKDPNFLYEIQNGLVDPVDAYRDIVDEYKDNLLRQSYESITQLKTGGVKPQPPHLEQGGPSPQNLVKDEDPNDPNVRIKSRLKELREKLQSGQQLTPDEEMEVAMTSMIKNPDIDDSEYYRRLKRPDFPV
jgi:hypothetical protein